MHIRTTTTPTSEGKIPIDIPQANKPCFTWYKIVGDLAKSNKTPLILLHGGPGCGHNYLLPFKDLWEKEQIPCIFYDQVGCGQSTRLREKRGDESFWTIELFIKELNNVIDHFDLRSRGFDILGQSWGGMLLAEYAILQPKGLRRCVIANSPASMPLWVEAAQTLLKGMPKDIQKVIAEADKERKYDTPEFKEANELFDRKHTYRVGVGEPWPGKYAGPSLNNLAEDDTVYWTMQGPSEFIVHGSLSDWTVIPRLHHIKVPVFMYNGQFDAASDSAVRPFFEGIEKIRWVTVENASHMTHLEHREKMIKLVGDFLN